MKRALRRKKMKKDLEESMSPTEYIPKIRETYHSFQSSHSRAAHLHLSRCAQEYDQR